MSCIQRGGGRKRLAQRGELLDHPELQNPRGRTLCLPQGRAHPPAVHDQPSDPVHHAQSLGQVPPNKTHPRIVNVVTPRLRHLQSFRRQEGVGVTLTFVITNGLLYMNVLLPYIPALFIFLSLALIKSVKNIPIFRMRHKWSVVSITYNLSQAIFRINNDGPLLQLCYCAAVATSLQQYKCMIYSIDRIIWRAIDGNR